VEDSRISSYAKVTDYSGRIAAAGGSRVVEKHVIRLQVLWQVQQWLKHASKSDSLDEWSATSWDQVSCLPDPSRPRACWLGVEPPCSSRRDTYGSEIQV
jgi:hypothetical protein